MQFNLQENDLAAMIAEVYDTIKIVTSAKGIGFELDVASDLPKIVFDRDKIT